MVDDAPHLSRRKRAPKPAPDWPEPVEGRCNYRLMRGGRPHRCGRWAGWGTTTPGYGTCRTHAGQSPSARAAATQQMYSAEFAGKIRFGQVLDQDPRLGLVAEFARTNGFVAYLRQQLEATVGEDGQPALLHTVTTAGGGRHEDVHPLVRVWQWERTHLVKVAKLIEDIGFSEAQLDLFAAYQEHVLDMIEGVIRDLGHDPRAPEVAGAVTRQLALVSARAGTVGRPAAGRPAAGD